MEDLFGINAHRKAVANNIQKALGAGYEINDPENPENEMQKARVGVYADTVENRRLNRVGQAYGHKKQENEESKSKTQQKKEKPILAPSDVSEEDIKKMPSKYKELNKTLDKHGEVWYNGEVNGKKVSIGFSPVGEGWECHVGDKNIGEEFKSVQDAYKAATSTTTSGSGKSDMSGHAAKASDGALKRAAADENAPEDVRNAAKKELKKRGGSEDKSNDNYFTEDGSLNKENSTIKRMWELDDKLGKNPDKNSDEYKEYVSLREKLDYETEKMNNEKMLKFFPNLSNKNFPSFEEWKKRKEERENDEELNMKLKREEEKEAKEEKKQEDFDDISSDIDSIAWYMADNPEEDESGNKYEYKDGDIQNEVVKKFGTKIRKIVEKYGKGETISLIAKHSETFDRIRSRRLVNACLKSE